MSDITTNQNGPADNYVGKTSNATSTQDELIAQFITPSELELFEGSNTAQDALVALAVQRASRTQKQAVTKVNLGARIADKRDPLVSLVPGKALWSARMVAKVFEHNGWHRKVERPNAYGDAMGLKGLSLPKVGNPAVYHLKSIGATPEEKAAVQKLLDSAPKDAVKLITVQEGDFNLEGQA